MLTSLPKEVDVNISTGYLFQVFQTQGENFVNTRPAFIVGRQIKGDENGELFFGIMKS